MMEGAYDSDDNLLLSGKRKQAEEQQNKNKKPIVATTVRYQPGLAGLESAESDTAADDSEPRRPSPYYLIFSLFLLQAVRHPIIAIVSKSQNIAVH